RLLPTELEQEIAWKPLTVPLNCLKQHLGGDLIKLSQVAVQHDFLATNQEDGGFDSLRRNQRLLRAHILFPTTPRRFNGPTAIDAVTDCDLKQAQRQRIVGEEIEPTRGHKRTPQKTFASFTAVG